MIENQNCFPFLLRGLLFHLEVLSRLKGKKYCLMNFNLFRFRNMEIKMRCQSKKKFLQASHIVANFFILSFPPFQRTFFFENSLKFFLLFLRFKKAYFWRIGLKKPSIIGVIFFFVRKSWYYLKKKTKSIKRRICQSLLWLLFYF